MKLGKVISILLLTIGFLFVYKVNAYAICPICTIAVGAGLGLSRWLGIDDIISGLWVGALILSSSFWLNDFLSKKYKITNKTKALSIMFMYLIVIVPLYYGKILGHNPNNILLRIDKLLLGIIVGSFVFTFGVYLNKYLKSINNDKVYFYYQKVIIPVFLLAITSIIFYIVVK